uniref:N-acetylglucosamine-6-phosphate deacetylase n=1 Tax=Romanomermis culicivorax TaxID=13658 RepID=A0A915IDH1_ROMCU
MKPPIARYDDPDRLTHLPADMLIQYCNCQILRGKTWVDADLWVENGRIVNPEPICYVRKRLPDLRIDCCGNFIAPGYIDVQINGGFGVDFSSNGDALPENISKVAMELVKFGVTSFCPTIVSSSPEFYKNALEKMRCFKRHPMGANCLGLHLEGPFINKQKKGAHAERHFVNGFSEDGNNLENVYGSDLSHVCYITMAPELPFAMPIIRRLTSSGIKISLGHSTASITVGEEAVINGASCITHLFNAMLPFHHRDPGLVGLLTSARIPKGRTLFFGVISDGVHTHDAALRIAHRTHPDGLILVTDAVALLGLGDGTHRLGDMNIEVKNKRALIAGTETITGSISPLDYCVRHFQKAARCDSCEALDCASLHPAQFLGIDDRKGQLGFNCDADFLILNRNLNVLSTYIEVQFNVSRFWLCTIEKNSAVYRVSYWPERGDVPDLKQSSCCG